MFFTFLNKSNLFFQSSDLSSGTKKRGTNWGTEEGERDIIWEGLYLYTDRKERGKGGERNIHCGPYIEGEKGEAEAGSYAPKEGA